MVDESNDEIEDDYPPKTIAEVLDLWLSQDEEYTETELIIETPKNKLNWLHANLKSKIIALFELEDNEALREVCGSKDMTPEEASMVLMEKLWEYWHPE